MESIFTSHKLHYLNTDQTKFINPCMISKFRHATSSYPYLTSHSMLSASPFSILPLRKQSTRISCSDGELRQKLIPRGLNALFRPSPSPPKSPFQQSTSDSSRLQQRAPLILSESWREIQGEKHWEGLLEHPIDATLRAEIIRYGEFAQVCYDAFDFNEHSLFCGSCKYNRGTLFEKVDKGQCGYEVTKYLYATSKLDLPKFLKKSERDEEKRWSRDSNWIGYIAVCTDEAEIRRIGRRDIVIAWRGTVTKTEWVEDLMTTLAPANIELAPAASFNGNSNNCAEKDVLLQRTQGGVQSGWKINDEELSNIVKVESGFLSLYSSNKAESRFNKLSAGQQMAMEVRRLLQKYEGEEVSISITGHSLGAALALLCAYDIAANVVKAASPANVQAGAAVLQQAAAKSMSERRELNIAAAGAPPAGTDGGQPNVMITVFSFAGPRVGNRALKRRLEQQQLGVRVLRIVNIHDCVPKVPGLLFNECSTAPIKVLPNASGYHHVGKELLIDLDISPHLRRTRDLPSHHNLEAYLHVLDGFHGPNFPFQSIFGRSPVLVNKSSDFLKREAHIPPSWWQESNKGLVKDPSSGQWVLASREEDHLPEIH